MSGAEVSETPRIRRLDAATIAQIAAGEVVERPASVVKELVENALDAGATNIDIRLEGGGLERIEVSDNGAGIPPDELRLAVERHATSKLGDASALSRIRTLGFRGEALAAIAAVSHLTILSCAPGRGASGGLELEGGEVVREFTSGRPPGTTVVVRDLFFNTPARRKFMRAASTEQTATLATIERLYLAQPSVAYTVASVDRELLRWPAARSLSDAVARVLGSEFLGESFEVSDRDVRLGSLEGVFGRPALARPTPEALYVSVNGRAVLARPLVQAIRSAYADVLPRNRYPVGALHWEAPLDRLDVNVHPTKHEIRIGPEPEAAEWVRARVRAGLFAGRASARVSGTPEPRALELGDPAFASSFEAAPAGTHAGRASGLEVEGAIAQRTLLPVEPSVKVAPAPRLPRLSLLAPLFRTYWLAESEEGLVLADQHALSERLVYDALRQEGRLTRQALLEPVRRTLSPRQASLLATHRARIEDAGFDVEAFGESAVRIRSVPSYRGRPSSPERFLELLAELAEGPRPVPGTDSADERLTASIACHAAIRAGDVVPVAEIARLLENLSTEPERIYACPHGRPILVALRRAQLERWFLRTGT